MQDPNSVIVQAAHGFVSKLAEFYEVTLTRMYEILGHNNPYPKICKLLRAIGTHNPDGLRLIQADFNERCERILGTQPETTLASIHKELADVIQAELDKKPSANLRNEIREAIARLQSRLSELDEEDDQ